jgi:hypothetical protein
MKMFFMGLMGFFLLAALATPANACSASGMLHQVKDKTTTEEYTVVKDVVTDIINEDPVICWTKPEAFDAAIGTIIADNANSHTTGKYDPLNPTASDVTRFLTHKDGWNYHFDYLIACGAFFPDINQDGKFSSLDHAIGHGQDWEDGYDRTLGGMPLDINDDQYDWYNPWDTGSPEPTPASSDHAG